MPVDRADPIKDAEHIAIQALAFLAEDPSRLSRFFSLTGMTPDALTSDAGNPAVLTALLDHLMGDESLLLTFPSNCGVEPADIARARRALAGGGGPDASP